MVRNMPAYVIFIREKTYDQSELDAYAATAGGASVGNHRETSSVGRECPVLPREGARKCPNGAMSRLHQTIFDWLDETLARSQHASERRGRTSVPAVAVPAH